MPQKTIWLYTGYEWDFIFDDKWYYHPQTTEKLSIYRTQRQDIIKQCNVLVDGCYIESQRDISLKWRGSSNQRCIAIQESLKQGKIILYCD